MEVLTPTVKHGEEADGRTQMLGSAATGSQPLPEENAEGSPGIL
jgi:hypothetical protein